MVESFTSTNIPANVTSQALHIGGNHAYVYGDPHTKQWITRHHSQTPGPRPAPTMQTVPKAAKTSLEDWAPHEQVTRDLSGHYYVAGEEAMLRVRAEYHRLAICPKVYLSDPSPQNVCKMMVTVLGAKARVGATIHCVRSEYRARAAFERCSSGFPALST